MLCMHLKSTIDCYDFVSRSFKDKNKQKKKKWSRFVNILNTTFSNMFALATFKTENSVTVNEISLETPVRMYTI